MVRDVVGHEGGDEIVAVVKALVHAQRERLASVDAGRLEQMRAQLFGQEFIGQSWSINNGGTRAPAFTSSVASWWAQAFVSSPR